MFRPDGPDATASRPAPGVLGTQKWLKDGVPGGAQGSKLNARLGNMILAEMEAMRALDPDGDPGADINDDTQLATSIAKLIAATAAQTVPYSIVEGFHCAQGGSDPDHDVTIGPGLTRDASNTYQIDFAAAGGWTKQLDALWSAGDDGGAMPTAVGVMGTGGYYLHALVTAAGLVDFGGDTSATAANLLADPAVSGAGFVGYRCVGFVYGTAGVLLDFFHNRLDPKRWSYGVPALVHSSIPIVTTAVVQGCPFAPAESTAQLLLRRTETDDSSTWLGPGRAGDLAAPGLLQYHVRTDDGVPFNGGHAVLDIELDDSQQFYHRTDEIGGSLQIQLLGFIFDRGALPGRRP